MEGATGILGMIRELFEHRDSVANPHNVTKAQVGLANATDSPRRIVLPIFQSTTAQTQNQTRYHTHFAMLVTEADAQYLMPACTLKKFSFYIITNSYGFINSLSIAVRKNGVSLPAFTETFPGGQVGRITLEDSVDFEEDDLLSVRVITPNAAGNLNLAPGTLIFE